MPAILDRRDYAIWLTAAPIVAESVLQSYPQDQMVAHPVGPRINSLSYDDPQLIRPAEHLARSGLAG
jgi:putative SOS response-associated peptidase YedK